MGSPIEIITNNPQETFETGRRIASSLKNGSIVALNGNLGSGKTCLVKGMALGLGINENITSPTYTIINEYFSSPALFHIDAYRLESEKEFEDMGGSELINNPGIFVIEWSEKIINLLPDNIIRVTIEITGASSRLIRINGIENL